MPSRRVKHAGRSFMCGIAGFIQKSPNPEALPRMLARIAHRGPDGEGDLGPPARRLARRARPPAPVDHRRRGRHRSRWRTPTAPSSSPTTARSTTSCACARLLEARGRQFRTRSDTEVILQHFEQHGVGGIPELDGMFAFAIWEARDAAADAGARPRRHQAALLRRARRRRHRVRVRAVGAARARRRRPRAVDRGPRVVLLLGLRAPAGDDRAQGAQAAARPHHHLAGRQLRAAPRLLGDAARPRPRPSKPDAELAAELWSDLDRAVTAQLVSDVPVGIFLSGGIDSSCVATAAVAAGGRMKAFSIGFDERDLRRDPRTRAWWPSGSTSSGSPRRCTNATCSTCWTPRSTTSTSRWPIRRSCRRSCCRGWRPATSRSSWAATAATSCGAATRPTARTGMRRGLRSACPAGSASTSSAASSGGCRSTIATRAWSGSCAGSRSAGTTTW